MTGDPRKAAIYTRTNESRVSVDRQRAMLTAMAAERGWSATELYADGKRDSRELDRLRADIAAGRVAAVVTPALSSLSRTASVVQQFVQDAADRGVQVLTAEGGFDGSTAEGRAEVGILTALAEYEQETYHARADRGMEYATRKLSEARDLIEADSEAAVSLMVDASKALDEAIRWARGEAADEDRQDGDA